MLEFATTLIVAASDESSSAWLLVLGPLGGIAFYSAIWMRYRNTNKSHSFERETAVELRNQFGEDVKVGVNNGTTARWIRGRNDNSPRKRL